MTHPTNYCGKRQRPSGKMNYSDTSRTTSGTYTWLSADGKDTGGNSENGNYTAWSRCGTRPSPTSDAVCSFCPCVPVGVCGCLSCCVVILPVPNCLPHHVPLFDETRLKFADTCFYVSQLWGYNKNIGWKGRDGVEARNGRRMDEKERDGAKGNAERRRRIEVGRRRNGMRRRRKMRWSGGDTMARRRMRGATEDGGRGDADRAGDPQVSGSWVLLVITALAACGARQRQQPRRQRDDATTMTGIRIACCWKAKRRRRWSGRELAAIRIAVRRENLSAMRSGAVLLVQPAKSAAPALGVYLTRGWMRPPAVTALGAYLAQGCGGGRAGKTRDISPEEYAHHGRSNRRGSNCDGGGRRSPTTTTRRGAALKHKRSSMWLKAWVGIWLKWLIIVALAGGVGERIPAATVNSVLAHSTILTEGPKQRVYEGNDSTYASVERYGEARHPGPAYRATNGGMTVTTGNGTSWGTILDWLSDHRGEVVCAQEHKLMVESDIANERSRVIARGWKSAWAPATPSGTAANEASGGAAIFVRSHIGVEVPPGGEVVVPGQVAATMIETARSGGWLCIRSTVDAARNLGTETGICARP